MGEGWNPILEKINKNTETVFSKALLTATPEVVIREKEEEKQFRRYGGRKLTVFVSDEEIKSKQLDDESLIGVAKHVIRARTGAFRPFLPADIRQATDDVATEGVIWEIRPDAIDEFYESLEPIDETKMETRSKVEQMILGAEYDDFCREILEEYGNEKPCLRVQTMVSESFERAFKKLQESFRGILVKISSSRFGFHENGLKMLLLPYNTPQLPRYSDAYAFIWVYPDGIRGYSPLENITQGKFDELWQIYSKTHGVVDGKSKDEVYKAMTDWVKGLGGKKGKASKARKSSGPALNVSFGLIKQLTELITPISKEEFGNLVQSRLTDFSMLTQKQVNTLIERGH
ncbi:MAG: hypothetical protein EAX81_03290 [Candidatus Thorarchaeota archaeon]|nr:hypothetical protein [Candidatus Thorarchaeota archaeon]